MSKPNKANGQSRNHAAPVFETLAILDDSQPDAETNAAKPSEARVRDAKKWVDENRL